MADTGTMTRPARRFPRLWRLARPARQLGDGAVAALVALACLGVIVALMGYIMTRLDPVTGDEPFYLVTAGSILRDGDIEETNNWANRDVDAWLPPDPLPAGWQGWPAPARGFPPHGSQTVRPGLYSKHGLGVVALILPGLALGGRAGVVFSYGVMAALTAANIYLLARGVRAPVGAALAITATLALTSPLLPYSFLIFPELPGALLTIYAFRRLMAADNNGWQALGVGLCLALLPWLQGRFALLALSLGAMLVVRAWLAETRTPLLPALAPAALSAAGQLAFYWYFYGRPWPNTQDHAGMTATVGGWVMGLVGLLLDQQWGLLIHAPVYLLVAAGTLALVRAHPELLAWLTVVALPYYLFIAAYNQWWGEWCPPARYLVTLAPLAAAPLGALWRTGRAPVAAVLLGLFSLPGVAVIVAFMTAPQLMYNHPIGRSSLLLDLAQRDLPDFSLLLPSFVVPDYTPAAPRLLWIAILLTLVLLTVLAMLDLPRRRRRAAAALPPADVDAVRPRGYNLPTAHPWGGDGETRGDVDMNSARDNRTSAP